MLRKLALALLPLLRSRHGAPDLRFGGRILAEHHHHHPAAVAMALASASSGAAAMKAAT